MKITFHLKTALQNLFSARLRTVLAMSGIVVGTASVVALLSAGKLATETALQQFKSLGTNLMAVSVFPEGSHENKPVLTAAKVAPLMLEVPSIVEMAPYLTTNAKAVADESDWDAPVIASNGDLSDVMHFTMEQGRFISDLDTIQNYCVLGHGVPEKMKVLNPMGKHIRLNHNIFTVIGVLTNTPQNTFFSADINNGVFIPLGTASMVTQESSINNIVMTLKPDTDIEKTKNEITEFFKKKIPGERLYFQSAKELIKSMAAQQEIFTLLLGFIGGISLIVGGIGVVNIMLASVAERQYEIGLRLALGALPRDIQVMFLMEAGVLGVLGGIIGVFLGLCCTLLISWVAGWVFTIFWFPPFIGFTVSLAITLFFGFYPALVAARVNPIDALRGI